MAQVSQLSAELARGVVHLARAVVGAARSSTLYPPEHPAVGQSLDRFVDAIRQVANGGIFAIAVTPDTLLVEGASADRSQPAIIEASALLHDCDILELAFIGEVPRDALRSFVKILTIDADDRRQRGGPAQIWAVDGHSSIAIQQVDYLEVLEREEGETPEPGKRDDIWRSIVLSITSGHAPTFDKVTQQRLLAIAGSPADILDLATAVLAPKCTMDGSPLIKTQAAMVLAAFCHLSNIVSTMSPARMPEVMGNLAGAAVQLDPHVMLQVLQTEEDQTDEPGVVRLVTAAFDDVKVAQLLATALGLDGQASDRLATIFNTIAPDPERKQRVLTLTRRLLSETDFGRSGQFQAMWTSMEELLVSYNDKPFMSTSYRAALDGLGARAERLAAVDLPPELAEWMESLGQENVRGLSVTLLIDLLTIEPDPERAAEIAQDMEALTEDLLMAGAYADATDVCRALAARAGIPDAIGREECRLVLDRLGEALAMRETVAFIGELDDQDWARIRQVLQYVGPSSVEALSRLVMVEQDTPASVRAADLITAFGAPAVPRLSPLVSDARWFVQRAAARLLGRIASPHAVPLLQPLLRKTDPRVAREAIVALGRINDPSAARAIHTVLRAATGELRRAIVEALVADRDPRVVPTLGRILEESKPLGRDHDVVLETIAAMGTVGHDRAVPALAIVLKRRAFFRRRKLRALKQQGVAALAKIGGPKATAAIEEAARTGDRVLKKILAARAT